MPSKYFYARFRSNLLKLFHVDTLHVLKYSKTKKLYLFNLTAQRRKGASIGRIFSWKFIERRNHDREWNRTRLKSEAGHSSKELDDDISRRERLISMCISHTNKGESSFTGFGSFGGTVPSSRDLYTHERHHTKIKGLAFQIATCRFASYSWFTRTRNGVKLSSSLARTEFIQSLEWIGRGLSTHEPKTGEGE